MIIAYALVLILAAIIFVVASVYRDSPADIAALSFSAKPSKETPVRATKGDRLDARPEVGNFAGV
jgi:hypothetical protein